VLAGQTVRKTTRANDNVVSLFGRKAAQPSLAKAA
jgi:hypothetical protein